MSTFAIAVYTNVEVSGPTTSMEAVAIHEIPLARRYLAMTGGESLTVIADWIDTLPRFRNLSHDAINAELERLRDRYTVPVSDTRTVDLVADIFGVEQGGLVGLQKAMKRVYDAFTEQRDENPMAATTEEFETLIDLVTEKLSAMDDIIPMDAETIQLEDDAATEAIEAGGIDGALIAHLELAGLSPKVCTTIARLLVGREIGDLEDAEIGTAAQLPEKSEKTPQVIAFIRASINDYLTEPVATE